MALAAMAFLALTMPSVLRAGDLPTGLGIECISLHYKEPGIMTEDGLLYGMLLAHEFDLEGVPVRSSFSLAYGKVQYKGGRSLESGGFLPVQLKSANTLLNMRATALWRHQPEGMQTTLIPYAGLGYRLLVDDLPTEWGYTRDQTYWYLPFGLEVEMQSNEDTTWTIGGEYDCFLQGYNVSGGDAFTQDGGSGFRLVARVQTDFDRGEEGNSMRFETFLRGWKVDESTVSPTGYYEPANRTTLYGASVSIFF
jgi:hypothetical protein